MERANHFIELALSERRRADRRTLLVDPNDPCGYSACRLTSPLNYLRGICPEQCVQLIRKFRKGFRLMRDAKPRFQKASCLVQPFRLVLCGPSERRVARDEAREHEAI